MKVKVYNQSGKPMSIEMALEYEKEFKAEYDVLWNKKLEQEITVDQMREALGELDKKLQSKYPMYDEVELPKTVKQFKNLIMSYQCPITIAITQETKELALFVMDSQYS